MFVRRSDMPFEFLVVAMTFTVCVTTVVAIGNVVKNLYLSGDNELLLRFPVNGKEILLAKSIYCFIHNVVINLLIMIPVCAIYGAVSSAPVGFYFVAIAVMIVAIPLPYAIANLLAIPVMMLMNLVKNQFLLVLILLIAAICGVFILYMTALSGVLEYMRDEGEGMFSPEVMSIFRNFADGAYPFRWYAMLLGGWFSGYSAKDAGLAFLYIFLITAAISVAAYFVTTRTYYKIILIGIETEKVSFQKKIPNIRRSVFGTLLHREFFLILRSFNYSFQYLAMAVAAPVMVYYCNDLAATMGKNTVGAAIVPGLTLLVIIIYQRHHRLLRVHIHLARGQRVLSHQDRARELHDADPCEAGALCRRRHGVRCAVHRGGGCGVRHGGSGQTAHLPRHRLHLHHLRDDHAGAHLPCHSLRRQVAHVQRGGLTARWCPPTRTWCSPSWSASWWRRCSACSR